MSKSRDRRRAEKLARRAARRKAADARKEVAGRIAGIDAQRVVAVLRAAPRLFQMEPCIHNAPEYLRRLRTVGAEFVAILLPKNWDDCRGVKVFSTMPDGNVSDSRDEILPALAGEFASSFFAEYPDAVRHVQVSDGWRTPAPSAVGEHQEGERPASIGPARSGQR